jgi:hypothetical protein
VKGQHYADVVRRLVRQAHEERTAERSAGPPADPARLVSAVEQALRARGLRRVVARRAVAASVVTFAAAAALVLVVGPRWRRADEIVATAPARARRALTVLGGADEVGAAVLSGAPPVALRNGMAIAAGLTLRAPAAGEVRIGTADGTSLALEGGELAVTEVGATQRFALRAGAVSARVSRLFAGERFIVDTKDAEIEVHGTSFRVAVVPSVARCGGGTTTRVSVFEGVVRVIAGDRETSVFPGGVWPEGCEAPATRSARADEHARVHGARAHAAAPVVEASPPERPAAPPAAASAPVAAPAPAPVAAPAPASSLAAENDLFERAVRAKQLGQLEEASRLFEELVSAHPASPLVESAMAQRMKVLAAVDPVAGQRAAAAYLARFPAGFARPEAQRLSGEPSP